MPESLVWYLGLKIMIQLAFLALASTMFIPTLKPDHFPKGSSWIPDSKTLSYSLKSVCLFHLFKPYLDSKIQFKCYFFHDAFSDVHLTNCK